ncbi:MAG: kinase/pyrophosphorylase [Thermoanaerobaculales bacterium]|nr:kinase/pyrophosphorylase [Thermoanaerobaculales bacterium]
MKKTLDIFIVSDATGATAEAIATSALVQFGGAEAHIHRHPFTRSNETVETIIEEADACGGMIVFTFVSSELSDTITSLGKAKGLVVIDLLGPLMNLFANTLDYTPIRTPGLFRSREQDLFKVTKAIDFTLRHDDGQGLDTIHMADLIILGVSRTGKTPTSVFLSCRKLKVANIPIVLGIPLPEGIATLPIPKVGFKMDIERQAQLRKERSRRIGSRIPGYSDRANIISELEYANTIFRKLRKIRTVDVTNRSIEETSDWITRQVL